MRSAVIVLTLVVLGGQAPAQEPSGRIDLEVVSRGPFGRIVPVRIGFVDSERDCPENRQTLRIWRAALMQIELFPKDPRPALRWQATMRPSDDETQVYQTATPTCRTEIAVRQQVRRDGAWTSLLVPRTERPSVPLEERQELQRQLRERVHTGTASPPAPTPEASEFFDRWEDAYRAIHSAGSLSAVGGTISWPFPFEDQPQVCFEALGDYQIERTGVMFSFMTGLPGDLNRFMIERADPDPYRGRIFFTRGDCRFELTISQSVLRDSGDLPVPLAPIAATKG